jgi:hypothetical protein
LMSEGSGREQADYEEKNRYAQFSIPSELQN